MKYTVVWKPTAIDELTELWLAAADRNAIERASNGIDRTLRDDDAARGDESQGEVGELEIAPLVVGFLLQRDDRKVIVATVRLGGTG